MSHLSDVKGCNMFTHLPESHLDEMIPVRTWEQAHDFRDLNKIFSNARRVGVPGVPASDVMQAVVVVSIIALVLFVPLLCMLGETSEKLDRCVSSSAVVRKAARHTS